MRIFTAVMYHYVRDVEQTSYPGIKALSISDFEGQLNYLERHYTFLKLEDTFAALDGDMSRLSQNGVLLTFDDGHRDHYDTVFPLLQEREIQGVFFPPAMPIIERRVLDVNKIQFILSRVANPKTLIDAINQAIVDNREEFSLDAPEEYQAWHAKPFGYDGADVIFIKRMLQHVLPQKLRTEVIRALFENHVTKDEQSFADDLYMSADHLREMTSQGMVIGSHGYGHHWMDSLTPEEQRQDISASLEFLETIGVFPQDWVMCYPYGGYDDNLIQTVKKMGCKLGFTTHPGIANLDEEHPLCLSRLDTNELPKSQQATT